MWNIGDTYEVPYREGCLRVATDESGFATFRSDPHIAGTVENATEIQALRWIKACAMYWPGIFDHKDFCRHYDSIGKPRWIHEADELTVSPTLLRYMIRAYDLEKTRKWLNGSRIVEIGGGYGGQAVVIHHLCQPASYTIVDIEEACLLQRRFFREFGDLPIRCVSDCDEVEGPIDFVLSDCAIAELDSQVRDLYGEKLLSRSPRGSVIWNQPSGDAFFTMGTDNETDWLYRDEDIREWLERFVSPSKVIHGINVYPYNRPKPWMGEGACEWYWTPDTKELCGE